MTGDHPKATEMALHALCMLQCEANSLMREIIARLPKPTDPAFTPEMQPETPDGGTASNPFDKFMTAT